MINTDMRLYSYFTLGEDNGYGQPQIVTKDSVPIGSIKMCINIASQSIQDNINYKNTQYVGLTQAKVDDTYIIKYKDELLKVLYINDKGRYKQVYLAELTQ